MKTKQYLNKWISSILLILLSSNVFGQCPPEPVVSFDVHAISCGTFTWIDGNTYTAPNHTAVDSLLTVDGCDSIVMLNLFLVDSGFIQRGEDLDGEAYYDLFGTSVSMPNVNTIAVGGVWNNGNGDDSGHTRIYTWNGLDWQQKGTDIYGENGGDDSGWSVSMPDDNTIAIGARYNSNLGHVRIYTWNGTTWLQKGIDIDGEFSGDISGYSVSMPNANTVAIGAVHNDGNGNNSGHVRIFSWDGLAWQQKGIDINGDNSGDQFGYSVSMPNANTVGVGAIFHYAGQAGVFQLTNIATSITNDIQLACDSYSWIDGVTYTASNNTATDTLINATGCDSIIVLDLTIISIDTSLTLSGETISSNETGAIYQWVDCNNGQELINGEINQSFSPSTNGSYAVLVVSGSCSGISNCVTISNIGINENELEQYISIFPNPSNGLVNIELGDLKDVQVKVFNTTGQLMYQKTNINTSLYQFKLNTVPGLYFIEVYAENAFRRVKLIMD